MRTTGRIKTVPLGLREVASHAPPLMVEPDRREAATAGNARMVPISSSLSSPL